MLKELKGWMERHDVSLSISEDVLGSVSIRVKGGYKLRTDFDSGRVDIKVVNDQINKLKEGR